MVQLLSHRNYYLDAGGSLMLTRLLSDLNEVQGNGSSLECLKGICLRSLPSEIHL